MSATDTLTSTVLYRSVPDAIDRARVLAVLREHGGSPRSYFATLPGMRWFEHRDALVPYRTRRGVAIALDEPLGLLSLRPAALARFLVLAARRGALAAVYKASAQYVPVLRDLGYSGIKFGEEALLDPREFSLDGGERRDLRWSATKMARLGYSQCWYDLAADPRRWRPALREISRQWLATKFGAEMHFAVGTLGLAERFAAEQRLSVLVDPAGVPAAFASFVPVYGPQPGWALDLMRRRDGLPGRAMDFLLACTIRALAAEGCAMLSLGLAPLADLGGAEWPGARMSSVRRLLFARFNHLYNFQGLARFKAKFQPRWEPRYLAYPHAVALPQVVWALYRAHFPHGKSGIAEADRAGQQAFAAPV